MPFIVAVSGFKNSGKTTLCKKLLLELKAAGMKTGYIKHTSGEVIASPHDTDTGEMLAVAGRAVYWGCDGVRIESKMPFGAENAAYVASSYFPDADIVLLEGGKETVLPKIWVCSEGGGPENYPGIFMIYDRFSQGDEKNVFGAGSEGVMAQKLRVLADEAANKSAAVFIGGKPLPMKGFVADFLSGGILGMLASLKGWTQTDEPISVYLRKRRD